MISIIIPASNEERYISECLSSILQSNWKQGSTPPQIIVVANNCNDRTVELATGFIGKFKKIGWQLIVLDLQIGGKINALNSGDCKASFNNRLYLDADVRISKELLLQVLEQLAVHQAAYVSGRPILTTQYSRYSFYYGRFWSKLPFMRNNVPGCGLFATNKVGRERWGKFPDIISDDTFARLNFRPSERIKVDACYEWPVIEGFFNLVRVRRRQDAGIAELARIHPELMKNSERTSPELHETIKLVAEDPIGFLAYILVSFCVRLPTTRKANRWERGR